MKKITALLLSCILILSTVTAIAAGGASVQTGTAKGAAGETVEIPVTISGSAGFMNLGIEIGYDSSVLTLKSAKQNSAVGATYTPAQSLTVNPYNMGWDSTTNVDFNGTLVTLTFEIAASAQTGEYPVTVSYYKGLKGDYKDGDNVNYDENFDPLKLTYINGLVTVEGEEQEVTPSPSPIVPSAPPAADGAKVTVSKVTGSAGETVEIPVTISESAGFMNLGIEIGYDSSVLTLKAAKQNSAVGATYTPAQSLTVNPYNMGWDSTADVDFNGILVTLTFEIAASAQAGEYPVTVSYYKGLKGDYKDGDNVNYDENFDPLNLTYINGSVTVKGAAQQTTPTPTQAPTSRPTQAPTSAPTATPTSAPTSRPTQAPATSAPTQTPSASGFTASVGNVSAKPGETIQIPIAISGNTGFSHMDLVLSYDHDIFTFVSSTPNDAVDASYSEYRLGSYHDMVWRNTDNGCTYNGTLVTLEFKVSDNAKQGKTYPFELSYYGSDSGYDEGESVYRNNPDFSRTALSLTYINGSVTIGGAPVTNPTSAPTSRPTAVPTEKPVIDPTDRPTPTKAPSEDSETKLSLSSFVTARNGAAEVPLYIWSNEGFVNLSVEFEYDRTYLELADIIPDDDVGAEFEKLYNYSGELIGASWTYSAFALAEDGGEIQNYTGWLAELKFNVKENAPLGEYEILIRSHNGADVNYGIDANGDRFALNMSYYHGSVTVRNRIAVYSYIIRGTLRIHGDIYSNADQGGRIYLAVYDEGGRLLSLSETAAEGGSFGINTTPPADAAYVKAMWWKDLSGMAPIADSDRATINNYD